MKKMFAKDLQKKSLKQLVKLRNEVRKALYEFRLKNAVRTLNHPHLITVARKNIARVNTVMKQKILAA